jgi:hypothetical protein
MHVFEIVTETLPIQVFSSGKRGNNTSLLNLLWLLYKKKYMETMNKA